MKKVKKAKYITVLDFEMGRVFQYNVGFQVNKLGWNLDSESCEDYLTNKGHNLQNCEWMVHKVAGIIKSGVWNSVL
jgi:hypothetical protein